MTHPTDETREQRRQLLQQALADTVRQRIARRRLQQTNVARRANISRSHLRALLAANKGCTLFVFLELSRGLQVESGELLGEVLERRERLGGLR